MMTVKELHKGLEKLGQAISMETLMNYTPAQLGTIAEMVEIELKRRSNFNIEFVSLIHEYKRENK